MTTSNGEVEELMRRYHLTSEQAHALIAARRAHRRALEREPERDRRRYVRDAIAHGVPVATLAAELGVTRKTIYQWESEPDGQ